MDLRLFHPTDDPTRNYKRLDRMNSRKNRVACHLYEWIGWYNMSVPQRLLGHYRLFQRYKARTPFLGTGMSYVRGYILQCRGSHRLKYFLNRCFTFTNFIMTWGSTDRNIEVHGINRILLYDRPDILQEFLDTAPHDFDSAFQKAMSQINDPTFLNPATPASNTLIQFHNDQRQNTFNNSEYHLHPIIRESAPVTIGATGKEKGVFSKKQILILFDLLAQTGKIERIDLHKLGKADAFARLLTAMTGKPTDSWLAELTDYKTRDLYQWHTKGERDQLISTLTNLAETFRSAGVRSIAKEVDKKMREIEMQR